MEFAEALRRVRERAPLVQCITNFVTVNDCANILLAAGGSPSMAHDLREAAEAVEGADALVCNLGAVEDAEAMGDAGRRANQRGIPVVLDPVAVGTTRLRRETAGRLLREVRFTAIRGNASEIRFLSGEDAVGSGVDAAASDAVTEENLEAALDTVRQLSRRTGAAVILSGTLDVICLGDRAAVLRNGCETMGRITGSGCMASSLVGAFCAALPEDPFTAACAAMSVMGVCGETAERRRLERGGGNAGFRTDLIDAVFNLTGETLEREVRCVLS